MPVLVEVAVDSVESAQAAQGGGAERVELCAGLSEGGTTPSAGLMAVCRQRLAIPLFVLIRPRAGDFLYSAAELEVMRSDIAVARDAGADGIVTGALGGDGTVDVDHTRALCEAAHPLPVTFHRAFDFTRDAMEALAAVASTGVTRILTSGRAATALDGIVTLTALVRAAPRGMTIVAGGGVTEDNVTRIVSATGVQEVHVRAATRRDSAMSYRRADLSLARPTAGEYARAATDRERVAAIVATLADH